MYKWLLLSEQSQHSDCIKSLALLHDVICRTYVARACGGREGDGMSSSLPFIDLLSRLFLTIGSNKAFIGHIVSEPEVMVEVIASIGGVPRDALSLSSA